MVQPNTNIEKARGRVSEVVDKRPSDRAESMTGQRKGWIQARGQVKEIGDELHEEW